MRKLNHGDALRPEKKQKRNDPQPNRYATIGGDGRNDVEIENSNHEEQNEVPTAQYAAQMRRFLGYRRWPRSIDLVRQSRFSPKEQGAPG